MLCIYGSAYTKTDQNVYVRFYIPCPKTIIFGYFWSEKIFFRPLKLKISKNVKVLNIFDLSVQKLGRQGNQSYGALAIFIRPVVIFTRHIVRQLFWQFNKDIILVI